jgi:hypothetical protein
VTTSSVPERPHKVLTLRSPIREGGEKGHVFIDVIYVKRPRAKEMRLVPTNLGGTGGLVGDLFPFAQQLCGLTAAEFDQLEFVDLMPLMEIVGGFVQEFPPGGPSTSSDSLGSSTGA